MMVVNLCNYRNTASAVDNDEGRRLMQRAEGQIAVHRAQHSDYDIGDGRASPSVPKGTVAHIHGKDLSVVIASINKSISAIAFEHEILMVMLSAAEDMISVRPEAEQGELWSLITPDSWGILHALAGEVFNERVATAPRCQQELIDNLAGVGTRDWLIQASRIMEGEKFST